MNSTRHNIYIWRLKGSMQLWQNGMAEARSGIMNEG